MFAKYSTILNLATKYRAKAQIFQPIFNPPRSIGTAKDTIQLTNAMIAKNTHLPTGNFPLPPVFFYFLIFHVKQFITPLCFAGSLLFTGIIIFSGNISLARSIANLSVFSPKTGKTKKFSISR